MVSEFRWTSTVNEFRNLWRLKPEMERLHCGWKARVHPSQSSDSMSDWVIKCQRTFGPSTFTPLLRMGHLDYLVLGHTNTKVVYVAVYTILKNSINLVPVRIVEPCRIYKMFSHGLIWPVLFLAMPFCTKSFQLLYVCHVLTWVSMSTLFHIFHLKHPSFFVTGIWHLGDSDGSFKQDWMFLFLSLFYN